MRVTGWRSLTVAGAVLAAAGSVSADLLAKGKSAPAWSGKTTAGKTLSSAQLKGKVVLMNFFNNY